MRSIPQAVKQAIENDGFLHFGLANGVLNLTKTAKFIRPLIESRTKKTVSTPAVAMALSRLKFRKRRVNASLKDVRLTALTVQKNLAEISYEKTAENVFSLERAEKELRRRNAYIVITLGTAEITALVDAGSLMIVKKAMRGRPKAEITGLVAIAAQFDEKYIPHVGLVYTLIQQLTFQNINIIEFSSTYTELVFYLHKNDLKIAFDTLYDQFM